MRLEGIVKSDSEKESVAIIAIENESKQYKKGDKLPVAPGVSLRTIDVDRIILDNNGSLEELLLFSKSLLQERRNSPAESRAPDASDLMDHSENEDVTTMMGWSTTTAIFSAAAWTYCRSASPSTPEGVPTAINAKSASASASS
jgi:type II secretory pathway component PulC